MESFQPEFYPGPLPVRNTFIDAPIDRPASLEDFLQERLIFSCPASRIEDPASSATDAECTAPIAPGDSRSKTLMYPPIDVSAIQHSLTSYRGKAFEDTPSECSTADFRTTPATPEGFYPPLLLPTELPLPPPPPSFMGRYPASPAPCVAAPTAADLAARLQVADGATSWPSGVPPPPPDDWPPMPVPPPPPAPQTLRLAEALGSHTSTSSVSPEVLATLPSLGSVGHAAGECRPCAFVTTKGCKSGKECEFCHLCAPGEKKRRQKVKRHFFSQLGSAFGSEHNWFFGPSPS
jgi:hypothetical protein